MWDIGQQLRVKAKRVTVEPDQVQRLLSYSYKAVEKIKNFCVYLCEVVYVKPLLYTLDIPKRLAQQKKHMLLETPDPETQF